MYNADDALKDLENVWAFCDPDGYIDGLYDKLKEYLLSQRYKEGIPELLRRKHGRNLRRKDRT